MSVTHSIRRKVGVMVAAGLAVVVLPASSAMAVPNVSGKLYHYGTAPGPCTLKAPTLYATYTVSASRSRSAPWFISSRLASSTLGPGQTGTVAYNIYYYSRDKRYGGCERINPNIPSSILRTHYYFATTPAYACYRMSYFLGNLVSTGYSSGAC